MMLNLLDRKLRYFLKVYEAGTIAKAAKELKLGHAALSSAMMALESELGVTLFEKKGRERLLNQKGKTFAASLAQEEKKLASRLTPTLETDLDKPLRIGAIPLVAEKVIIPKLAQLQKQFGKLQYHFGYSAKIYEQVQNGLLDFGFVVWLERPPRAVQSVALTEDPEVIVASKEHYPSLKDAKNLDELKSLTWIWHRMPQKDISHYLPTTNSGYVVDNYSLLKSLLFGGQGIAAVEINAFTAAERRLLIEAPFPFREKYQQARVYLIHAGPLADEARACAEEICRQIKKVLS